MDSIYPDRHSARLRTFDYGQTCAYFVSLCAQDRRPVFGQILNAIVQLSEAGQIVKEEWLRTPKVRPDIYLDE